MENTFWQMCTEIGFKHGFRQKKHWEPWKFFCDKYGEEEAQEMLDDGKLEVTDDGIAPPNRRNVTKCWDFELSRRGAQRCLVGRAEMSGPRMRDEEG
eukprot:9496866-Pyramimonas_sp.AAC.1